MNTRFYLIRNIEFFTDDSVSLVNDGMPAGYDTLEALVNHFTDLQLSFSPHNRKLIQLWSDKQLLNWWNLKEDYLNHYTYMLSMASTRDKNQSYRYMFRRKWITIEKRYKPGKVINVVHLNEARSGNIEILPGTAADGSLLWKLNKAINKCFS
jgi:hypothetical protein